MHKKHTQQLSIRSRAIKWAPGYVCSGINYGKIFYGLFARRFFYSRVFAITPAHFLSLRYCSIVISFRNTCFCMCIFPFYQLRFPAFRGFILLAQNVRCAAATPIRRRLFTRIERWNYRELRKNIR